MQIGQQVAFIYNSIWVVPATITRVYPDGRCHLEIVEIHREVTSQVSSTGVNAKIEEVEKFILRKRARLNVYECDPCGVIQREAIGLERPQGGNGMMQTHTDRWVEVAKRRLPRLSGIETSLIGKWFDPTKWNFVIYAKMDGFHNKILNKTFEGVELNFPQDGREFYSSFGECFNEWFAEALESRYMRQNGIPQPMSTDIGSWSRCEIQALEKENAPASISDEQWVEAAKASRGSNVQTSQTSARDQRKPQTHSPRTSTPKSRSRKSRKAI